MLSPRTRKHTALAKPVASPGLLLTEIYLGNGVDNVGFSVEAFQPITHRIRYESVVPDHVEDG